MPSPLLFIHAGTGGFGGYWCREVLPRVAAMGKVQPAAADTSPDALLCSGLALGDATR